MNEARDAQGLSQVANARKSYNENLHTLTSYLQNLARVQRSLNLSSWF